MTNFVARTKRTGVWYVADGWATKEEAVAHATALRAAHKEASFTVRHSKQVFGGGHWLVMYRNKEQH